MMYSWPMLHAKTMFDPKSEQQYMKAQCMKLMNQIIAIASLMRISFWCSQLETQSAFKSGLTNVLLPNVWEDADITAKIGNHN